MCYLSFFHLHNNWVGHYLGHFCKLFSCLAHVFLIIVLGFFQSFKTILFRPEWENSMSSLSTWNSLIRSRRPLFWHWCYSPDLLPLFTCGDLFCQEERFELAFFPDKLHAVFLNAEYVFGTGERSSPFQRCVYSIPPLSLIWQSVKFHLYVVHNGRFSQINSSNYCCESKSCAQSLSFV